MTVFIVPDLALACIGCVMFLIGLALTIVAAFSMRRAFMVINRYSVSSQDEEEAGVDWFEEETRKQPTPY